MVFSQPNNNNGAVHLIDPHSFAAWMRLRGPTFNNQLHLVVGMAFQKGMEGITASEVREAIASVPCIANRFGVSSPAARLSSAKKNGLLVTVNIPGEREGRYVHAAHISEVIFDEEE